MFRAIVVSRATYDQIAELIGEKVTIYPGTGGFRLLAAAEEEFPKSILESVQPVEFDSGYEGGVQAYPHLYHLYEKVPEDIYRDGQRVPWQELNRDLVSMKSKLNFTLTEMFSPEQLHFDLVVENNEVMTRRKFIYRLRYSDIDCQSSEDFLAMFRESLEVTIGPLMVSSLTLETPEVPRWWTRESFRDLIEMGDLNLDRMTVVTGAKSEHLYLFYKEPINLLNENVTRFINDLKGQLRSLIELQIFPRATPPEIIKNKRLIQLPSGQWKLPYTHLPENLSPFEEFTQRAITLRSADELFWFLALLMMSPTWHLLEPELKIYVEPNQIRVTLESKYLPDIIRVITAARVRAPTTDAVKAYYPKRLSHLERNRLAEKVYLQFYDQANQELCMLVTDDPRADSLEIRDFPKNPLERIAADFND